MQEIERDRSAARRAAIVGALGIVGGPPQERFDRITRMARDLFDVPWSYLNVADAAELHMVSPTDGPVRSMPLNGSFCQATVSGTDPVVVPDTRTDERFRALPLVVGDPNVRFYAGAPIGTPGGTTVGSLCIMDTVPRSFDERETELLQDLARWAERILAEGRRADDVRAVAGAFRPTPLTVPGWSIDGASTTPDAVAGGFHDWQFSEGGPSVTVAGVSGSSAGATVLAASLRSAIRARTSLPLGDAFRDVAAQVVPELAATDAHARTFTARVDTATGRIEFVDAGLGLVVHVRADGSPEVLTSRNLPIGLQPPGEAYVLGEVVLAPGESLLIGSDGLLRLHDDSIETLALAGRRLHALGDFGLFFRQVADQAVRRELAQDVTVVAITRRVGRHA
ncbi:PP2C family protein-serine/threonine phosphatase [Curtobacterium sp. RRHDQ10]|uniref:PP2C family protein-serine/threonine phosphatase n=1 Tax=Curtobacterium phyllosphaerae TaxID=3413379 RepID=UPI003BF30326